MAFMAMIEKVMHLEIYDPKQQKTEQLSCGRCVGWRMISEIERQFLQINESASKNCQTGPSCVDHLKRSAAGSTVPKWLS